MGKMSELDTIVRGVRTCGESLVEAAGSMQGFMDALKHCGESLIAASNELEAMFSAPQAAAPEPAPQAEPETHKVTIEEVRAVLLEKRRAGHTDEIKALLARFNANKLTEVRAEDYGSLLVAAKEIGP